MARYLATSAQGGNYTALDNIFIAKLPRKIGTLFNPVQFMSLFGHALFNYKPPQARQEGLVIFLG